jgi:urease alpha subunit
MKIAARITVLLLLAASLALTASCAWFQKNEPRIICAGESTVADMPELVAIITECATIAVSAENVVPCILAAAGSKWTEDVIACAANAQATQPVTIATGTGTGTSTSTTTTTATTASAQTLPSAARANAASTSLKPENLGPAALVKLKAAVIAKWGSRLGSSPR